MLHYFSHGFPIIEPPFNSLIIEDFNSSHIFRIQAAIDIRPNENRGACPIPYTIGCVGATGFLKPLLAFFSPYFQGVDGKLRESSTDIEVKPVSSG